VNDQSKSILVEGKGEDLKKPYARPELTRHGAVEALTQQPAPSTSQPNFDPV
jgi:hypothetical protein